MDIREGEVVFLLQGDGLLVEGRWGDGWAICGEDDLCGAVAPAGVDGIKVGGDGIEPLGEVQPLRAQIHCEQPARAQAAVAKMEEVGCDQMLRCLTVVEKEVEKEDVVAFGFRRGQTFQRVAGGQGHPFVWRKAEAADGRGHHWRGQLHAVEPALPEVVMQHSRQPSAAQPGDKDLCRRGLPDQRQHHRLGVAHGQKEGIVQAQDTLHPIRVVSLLVDEPETQGIVLFGHRHKVAVPLFRKECVVFCCARKVQPGRQCRPVGSLPCDFCGIVIIQWEVQM